MTYVLVLFACLPGGDCERHVVARGVASYSICMTMSQIMAAQWAGDHPKWHVDRISCEFGDAS